MPPNNQLPNPGPNQPIGSAADSPDQAATKKTQVKNPNSTQNTLLFSEIRDNLVVMSDGSFRALVICKSINFDLMSERERDGVELSYQNFLNSLTHPVQILIRSQRVDIGPYLTKLSTLRQAQDNMLLGVLMDDYINFIDILAQEANVMDKTFFVVVPYYPQGDLSNALEQSKGFFSKLFGKADPVTKIDQETYIKSKTELKSRVDGILSGLSYIGVRARQLNTQELGEVFYSFYNPDIAFNQPLVDFTQVTSTYVKKAGENSSQPTGEPQ